MMRVLTENMLYINKSHYDMLIFDDTGLLNRDVDWTLEVDGQNPTAVITPNVGVKRHYISTPSHS